MNRQDYNLSRQLHRARIIRLEKIPLNSKHEKKYLPAGHMFPEDCFTAEGVDAELDEIGKL